MSSTRQPPKGYKAPSPPGYPKFNIDDSKGADEGQKKAEYDDFKVDRAKSNARSDRLDSRMEKKVPEKDAERSEKSSGTSKGSGASEPSGSGKYNQGWD